MQGNSSCTERAHKSCSLHALLGAGSPGHRARGAWVQAVKANRKKQEKKLRKASWSLSTHQWWYVRIFLSSLGIYRLNRQTSLRSLPLPTTPSSTKSFSPWTGSLSVWPWWAYCSVAFKEASVFLSFAGTSVCCCCFFWEGMSYPPLHVSRAEADQHMDSGEVSFTW